MEEQENVEYDDTDMGYRDDQDHQTDDIEDKIEEIPQDLLAAAGLEDSDAEDNDVMSLSLSLCIGA